MLKYPYSLNRGYSGASPSGKAAAFGADIRGFESSRPSLSIALQELVNDDLPLASEPPSSLPAPLQVGKFRIASYRQLINPPFRALVCR